MSDPYRQQFPYEHDSSPQIQIQDPQMPLLNQYGQEYNQPPPSPPQKQQQSINITIDKPGETQNNTTSSNITNNGSIKKSKIEFNENPKYQDVWATFIFIASVIVTIVTAIVTIPTMKLEDINRAKESYSNNIYNKYGNGNYNFSSKNYYKRADEESKRPTLFEIFIFLSISFGSNIILTFFYIILVQKFTGKMIMGTLISAILLNIIYGIIVLLTGGTYLCIIPFAMAALISIAFFTWKKRIPFAKVMLKNVITVTKQYPATILIGFIGGVIAIVWYAFTIITIYCLFPDKISTERVIIGLILFIFLTFSLYFTTEVIKNTIHVTCSGLFATYYFRGIDSPEKNKIEVDVKNPTLKSLKRALTTSFGSICFGSLLISGINTLRALTRDGLDQSADTGGGIVKIIGYCAKWILKPFKDIIEYFNMYAFTEVAIYGKPFCQAAKDTWTLCKAHGIEALIKDNLIFNVFIGGKLLVGYISTAITFLTGILITENIETLIIFSIISFISSFLIFSIPSKVINSGVATTFVCLCEDPDTLRQTKPELYEKVKETYTSFVL